MGAIHSRNARMGRVSIEGYFLNLRQGGLIAFPLLVASSLEEAYGSKNTADVTWLNWGARSRIVNKEKKKHIFVWLKFFCGNTTLRRCKFLFKKFCLSFAFRENFSHFWFQDLATFFEARTHCQIISFVVNKKYLQKRNFFFSYLGTCFKSACHWIFGRHHFRWLLPLVWGRDFDLMC